jgi:hypothetical protein
MKKLFWIAITCITTFVACNKSNTTLPEDNGCIERIVIPVTAHSIKSIDVSTVNSLFINNGIDNSKFRYYQYTHDTLQTLYSPFAKYDQKTLKVEQYTNGLRIFTGDLVYNFLSDKINFKGGNLTNGTTSKTSPQLTLGQIRKLFVDNIEQFDLASNKFRDSCFKAEFGYYNLNAGKSNSQEELVKAWKVTLKNSIYLSEYPVAYYQDKNGKLIYYDNGIRTFK